MARTIVVAVLIALCVMLCITRSSQHGGAGAGDAEAQTEQLGAEQAQEEAPQGPASEENPTPAAETLTKEHAVAQEQETDLAKAVPVVQATEQIVEEQEVEAETEAEASDPVPEPAPTRAQSPRARKLRPVAVVGDTRPRVPIPKQGRKRLVIMSNVSGRSVKTAPARSEQAHERSQKAEQSRRDMMETLRAQLTRKPSVERELPFPTRTAVEAVSGVVSEQHKELKRANRVIDRTGQDAPIALEQVEDTMNRAEEIIGILDKQVKNRAERKRSATLSDPTELRRHHEKLMVLEDHIAQIMAHLDSNRSLLKEISSKLNNNNDTHIIMPRYGRAESGVINVDDNVKVVKL